MNTHPMSSTIILLVDDNLMSVHACRDYLNMKGYRVIVAHSGEEALQNIMETQPRLILMDVQMPGIDGLEATHRIRALPDPEIAATPIIALTALAMEGDKERCLDAGCNDYLSKPISLKILLSTIEKYLKPE